MCHTWFVSVTGVGDVGAPKPITCMTHMHALSLSLARTDIQCSRDYPPQLTYILQPAPEGVRGARRLRGAPKVQRKRIRQYLESLATGSRIQAAQASAANPARSFSLFASQAEPPTCRGVHDNRKMHIRMMMMIAHQETWIWPLASCPNSACIATAYHPDLYTSLHGYTGIPHRGSTLQRAQV